MTLILFRYREAGAEVVEVLSQFSKCVERASVDEAYIDLTDEVNKRLQHITQVTADQLPNTHISGYDVEMQSSDKGITRNNSRFASSLLDIINSDIIHLFDFRKPALVLCLPVVSQYRE